MVCSAASRGARPWSRIGLAEERDGFGVGLGLRRRSPWRRDRRGAPEVLDDAVVDDGDGPGLVRMGVGDGRRAVGGPAGMADARLAGQRVMHQQVGEIDELARRRGGGRVDAVVDRGDTGAVIAAIFQAFQRLDNDRGRFVLSEDSDNTAHMVNLFAGPLSRPSTYRTISGRGRV